MPASSVARCARVGKVSFALLVLGSTGCSAASDPNESGAGASGGASNASGGSNATAGTTSGGDSTSGGGTNVAGGGSANAGSSNAGSASGGTSAAGSDGMGGTGGTKPHTVTACDSLSDVGVWENITPDGVDLSQFGISHITMDPTNTSTFYVGTNGSGLYKTTDCGATWVHIDTGTLGAEIDTGTLGVRLDPEDPEVLYTYSLYGQNGFFKSTNGGVDWAQILSGDAKTYAPYGGFVGGIDIDPFNHLHLLVGWHAECGAPYNSSCYAETTDGGTTWTMRNGRAEWVGGEGAALQFLDSETWLFSSSSNGMWRSTDSGENWSKVDGTQISHGAGQLYRTASGHFFLGTATGVLYSEDGSSWELAPDSGSSVHSVVGDGTTVWTSQAFPYNTGMHPDPYQPYKVATEDDPLSWTTLESPMITSGAAEMAYDPDHHVLYGVNYWEGVWRVVVK